MDRCPSNLPINGHGFRRVEVLTGPERRRRWSCAEKARIVAESSGSGCRRQLGCAALRSASQPALRQERHPCLERVKSVFLIASPNNGSAFLLTFRRLFWWVFPNPQEEALRPYSRQISDIQRRMVEDFLFDRSSLFRSGPHFHVYAGESDGVVPYESAIAHFNDVEVIPGDHTSLLRIHANSDLVKSCEKHIRHDAQPFFVYTHTIAVVPVPYTD